MIKLWNKMLNNKLLTFSIVFALATVIFAPGCAIKAQITDPNNKDKVYLYHGPKDVEMSVKTTDVDIKYSGKTKSWLSEMLQYFLLKAPDIQVIK